VPFEVPGALFLLGSGLVTLGFAGLVLDNLWHTSFGLDETSWSAPHAMLNWAWLLALLGCVACRIALGRRQTLPWYTAVLLGFLILSFSAGPFLGPLNKNNTPAIVRAIASIPAFAVDRGAQHALRIYLAWGIERTNPLLAPLGALWAGVALALVRSLNRRAVVFLSTVLLWSATVALAERGTARWLDTFFPVSGDPAAWLPYPLFPAALALVAVLGAGISARWAWAIAGALFGFCVFAIWGNGPFTLLVVLTTAPAMLLGALIGERIFRILERPTELAVKALVLSSICVPLLTGAVDLYLRVHTP
jgi:hypothetical protein